MKLSSRKFQWIAYLETTKALRELLSHLMPSRPALPDFSVFGGGRKVKRVRRNRIKKDHKTNIIATNFVWEQLKSFAIV